MSIVQQVFKTITCNGPSCKNTVQYDANQQGAEQQVAAETPWMKTLRLVQNAQGRNFAYCSDACELENVGLGAHNPEERKSIILPAGANAMAVAAEAAAKAEEATKALKKGTPVTVQA